MSILFLVRKQRALGITGAALWLDIWDTGSASAASIMASISKRNSPARTLATKPAQNLARKRLESELALLHELTSAISDAQDFPAALSLIVRKICEVTSWCYGEAWVPRRDGSILEAAPAWCGEAKGMLHFRRESRENLFRPNEGLPGRVWMARKALWSRKVSDEKSDAILRGAAAHAAGFVAAFGVPILAHDQVQAVLVFFLRESSPRADRQNTKIVTAIVRQFGSLIERRRSEDSLLRYAQRLETMRDIDEGILAARSPEMTAQAALRHVPGLLPCSRASVIVFDLPKGEGTVLAAYTLHETKVGAGVKLSVEEFGDVEGLRDGNVFVVHDATVEKNIPPLFQFMCAEGARCYANVPLRAREQLIGALSICADSPYAFSDEHLQIAREVARPLAIAIEQSRLSEYVERTAEDLRARVAQRTAELEEINTALETFCFSISHDLRAPLRAIQGFAVKLLEDCAPDLSEKGQGYTNRIIAAARRMDTLIQDLLEYSRLSRTDLHFRQVNLVSLLAEVRFQLDAEIHERGAHILVSGPMPTVVTHRATLAQMISNLITNGIKFVAPGVTPRVRIWAEEKARCVRLYVEDNGIGIEPEKCERIFHIFERLHGVETYPGTGIGLAIVRKGAERLGGRAGVDSIPNGGSTFWIELPARRTGN